jgi:transcriptional regulator GlxA family with amidase domain
MPARASIPGRRFEAAGVVRPDAVDRLRRARALIERTSLTLDEVMALVGYVDPDAFSRDFQLVHGMTPAALRASGVVTPFGARPP